MIFICAAACTTPFPQIADDFSIRSSLHKAFPANACLLMQYSLSLDPSQLHFDWCVTDWFHLDVLQDPTLL